MGDRNGVCDSSYATCEQGNLPTRAVASFRACEDPRPPPQSAWNFASLYEPQLEVVMISPAAFVCAGRGEVC